MSDLVPTHIRELNPYIPGKPIEEVQRELGLDDVIKLASNENPYGPSPLAQQALATAISQLHNYPDGGSWHFKGALSERFAFPRDHIMVGNGSNELLEILIRTFMARPEDNGVTSEATFIVYKLVSQAAGRDMREAPLGSGYRYDLEAMARLVDRRTRIIFIANPNNPTGTYVSAQELNAFIDAVDHGREHDRPLIVLDEAYREYVDAEDYPDSHALVRARPRTVALGTFSKAYGLAGVRCGYGFASPDIIDCVNRVRQPFNVSSLAQIAATAALGDTEFLNSVVARTREGRQWLTQALGALGLEVVPSQTNFVLVKVPRSGAEVFKELMRQGVIVRPMGGYGLADMLRVTVGTPAQNQRCVACFQGLVT